MVARTKPYERTRRFYEAMGFAYVLEEQFPADPASPLGYYLKQTVRYAAFWRQRSGIDNRSSRCAHFRRVDTTRCLRPPGYGERIEPLQAFLCPSEWVSKAST
jgi:hypothetical protein